MEIAWIYMLTFLIPINGILFLGIRNERKKNKHLIMALWKMQGKMVKKRR